ncbi:MAG: pilus assembly protein TadE [Micrococcales bacterium]|nr:MAG: pilus assembly protein TadE [Micrococcales bacterium]
MTKRPHQWSERGAAALETIGLLPVIILAGLIALQFGIAGWTVVSTSQAARDAARAASLERDPVFAAEEALPGILTAQSVRREPEPGSHRYTVEVEVPSVVLLELGSVRRTAEMPGVK